MTMTPTLVLTDELTEQLLEELSLTHPDTERLTRYIWLVQSYPLDSQGVDYFRDNLAKWVRDEEESYYGHYTNTAEFVRDYLENYTEAQTPDWVVIDYEATWNRNLRHDFTAEDSGWGVWVWADIY